MRAILRLNPHRLCRPPWRPWNSSRAPHPWLSPGPLVLSLLAATLLLGFFAIGVAPGSPATARAETLAEETSPLPAEEMTPARGISLRGWWSDPEGPDAPMLQAAWAGMSWVALEVPVYRPDSLSAVMAGPEAPSDTDLVRAIWAARGLGLKVALKLEIEGNPNSPAAPRAAFRDTRDFVAFYADLAEANGVEMVWLGARLVAGGEPSPQLKEMTSQLRGRYRGPITFRAGPSPAAQPGPAPLVDWWEALGYAGVITGGQPLEQTSSPESTRAATAESGQAVMLRAGIQRPVLFIEAVRGEMPAAETPLLPSWLAGKPWAAGTFWGKGPAEGQSYPSSPSLISIGQPLLTAKSSHRFPERPAPDAQRPRGPVPLGAHGPLRGHQLCPLDGRGRDPRLRHGQQQPQGLERPVGGQPHRGRRPRCFGPTGSSCWWRW